MLMKSMTAGLLAVSLTFSSLAPNTASAGLSDEEAIFGVLSLLILGAAIHSRRGDDARSNPAPHPLPIVTPSNWRVLPSNCIRTINGRNGNRIRIFGQRCLTNNYEHPNRLPEACHVRGHADNGARRQGYGVRCMRNQGFRTEQR